MGSPSSVGFTGLQYYTKNTLTDNAVVGENIGTGDDTTKDFTYVVSNVGSGKVVVPGTVQITVDGSVVLYDDSKGSFDGQGSGTIDYENGFINITFDNAPASGKSIDVDYHYYSNWPPSTASYGDTLVSRKSPKVIYDKANDRFWIAWIETRDTINRISELCFGFEPVGWNFRACPKNS